MSNRKRARPGPGPRPGDLGYLGYERAPIPPEVHWTPLACMCGCVIDWGWGGDGSTDPLSFILFVMQATATNCLWHGAETGIRVTAPRSGIVRLQNGPGGQRYIYLRRATGPDVALGHRLIRELDRLARATDAELTAQFPHYAAWAAAHGYDAVEAIRQGRFTDLILNRGEIDSVGGLDRMEAERGSQQ